MEFIGPAIEAALKIGELLVKHVGASCGYLIFYDDNINSMKDALKALEYLKQEVQLRVDADKRNGLEALPRVEEWLREVKEIQDVIGSFNEDEASRNKKCLGGWCPNLVPRYLYGRRAKKNTDKLKRLKEQKFETIFIRAPPLKYGAIFTSKGIKSFESRNQIITGVIEKLKEEGCNRISICGMGGVGKTTLVKQVIKIVEAEKLFGEAVMVAVSQTVDNWKIQGEIADRLDITLSNKESQQGRAQQLLRGIINKIAGVLIVLDDVWTELDFESIGLPSNEDHNKACKFIFTSRNEGACFKMGSQKNFTVDTLSREDSWALFQEITGADVVNNFDIHPIAKKIANQCGGLPIAIVTVGKALQGKKEMYHWEKALSLLGKSTVFLSEVEKCIELSYSMLDKERGNAKHKYFLFLCCLFSEDANIPIEFVMWEGWGLGLFKDQDTIWEARNEAHTLVNDLKTSYLLLDGDMEECVKMHDVVRDVITSVASKKGNDFKIQYDAKKWWHEISIRDSSSAASVVIDEVKEGPNFEEYPKLELLRVASSTRRKISIPTNFFRGMTRLKVLYLQNSCVPKATPLSPALNNIRTLRLERCQVGDASIVGKELLALEILSFAHSNITELPTEIGQLGSLRLLDLTLCNELCKISSNVFARLFRLEELYFWVKNFPWMQNNEFLIELKTMSHRLKVVDIKVRKVEPFLKDLIFENVSRFWLSVMPYVSDTQFGFLEPSKLRLRAVDYNSVKSSMTIKHLVKRCETLIIEKVKNLKSIACELEGDGLPHLKDLKISKCSNLEYLIDDEEDKKAMSDFSNLVKLELRELPKLTCLRKANDMNKSHRSTPYFLTLETILINNCDSLEMAFDLQGFHNLRVLTIIRCDFLTHIFTCAIGRAIPELERLEIAWCNQVVNLVGGSIDNEGGKVKTIVFSKLHYLLLAYLPKFESISSDLYGIEWPSLTQLDINNCPMLKTLPFQTQRLRESNSLDIVLNLPRFQNLRALTISNCHFLTYILTPAIGRAASELEKLKIESCKQMAILVGGSNDLEEEDYKTKGKVNTIVFNKLHSLSFFDLPKLESFSSNSYGLEWPSLKQLVIDHCPLLNPTSFQTQRLAMQDNVGTSYSNICNTDFGNSKEYKSMPFNWLLGCAPLPPRFIDQGNTNKTSNKATTIAQDQIPSIFKMKSIPILENIHVRKCDDLLNILLLHEENNNPTSQSCLKTIQIEDCDKLQSIMAKGEEMINYFAQLQYLDLKYLPNLARFCFFGTSKSLDQPEAVGAYGGDQRRINLDPLIDVFLFTNLRSLFIKGCNKIHSLFSSSSLRSLKCLEKLYLKDCENIEEIVSCKEKEESANKIMLYELQHLLLEGLPNIKAFCQNSSDFDFPSLQKVGIEDCPNMEVFSRGSLNTPKLEDFTMKIQPHVGNHIHKGDLNATIKGFNAFVQLQGSDMLSLSDPYNEGIIYFKSSEMDIKMFHKLLKIVPYDMIHMLQNVRKLNISECDSLVEVFEYKGGVDVEERDATIYYELRSMNLKRLPKLKHIWAPNIMELLGFDKLKSISITSCHNLRSLMSYSMTKSLMHLEELYVENCKIMEEIVTKEYENKDQSSKVMTLFPKLKRLALNHLPKLGCFCLVDSNDDLPLHDEGDKKIKKMDVISCHNILSLTLSIHTAMLQQVWELNIKECDSLVEVFGSKRGLDRKQEDATTHYEIKNMNLENLPKLRHIWGSNIIRLVSFDKLTSIVIVECHSMECLLSSSMARSLVQLHQLLVLSCNMMEVIVKMDDENMDNRASQVKTLFSKLQILILAGLPKLEYICSQDYNYNIPLSDEKEEKKEINNNQQIQISFPQLNELRLFEVPSLKCFCPGAYDYDLMLSSSCVGDCTQITSFPNGKVFVSTPSLDKVHIQQAFIRPRDFISRLSIGILMAQEIPTIGDLNLTLHYFHNSNKYKVELQNLETLRCIEQHQYQHLLAYIMRETRLVLKSCHKLLKCIPSNMVHIFQHLKQLYVQQCGCLEEIFESNNYEEMKLTWMELKSLPKLKHLWRYHGPILGFQNLKWLSISECHDLKFVFPDVSIALSLPQLWILKVRECNKIEEIIHNNNNNNILKGIKIIFPALWAIELKKLPKLNCVCESSFYFELPNCRYIKIEECPNMETFCYGALYTPKLQSFHVEGIELDKEEEVNEVIQELRRS